MRRFGVLRSEQCQVIRKRPEQCQSEGLDTQEEVEGDGFIESGDCSGWEFVVLEERLMKRFYFNLLLLLLFSLQVHTKPHKITDAEEILINCKEKKNL